MGRLFRVRGRDLLRSKCCKHACSRPLLVSGMNCEQSARHAARRSATPAPRRMRRSSLRTGCWRWTTRAATCTRSRLCPPCLQAAPRTRMPPRGSMQCSGRSPRWRRHLRRLRRGPLPPRPRLCLRAAHTTRRRPPSRCGAGAPSMLPTWRRRLRRSVRERRTKCVSRQRWSARRPVSRRARSTPRCAPATPRRMPPGCASAAVMAAMRTRMRSPSAARRPSAFCALTETCVLAALACFLLN